MLSPLIIYNPRASCCTPSCKVMGNKNQTEWVLKCIIYTINPIHFLLEGLNIEMGKKIKRITAQYNGELTLVE